MMSKRGGSTRFLEKVLERLEDKNKVNSRKSVLIRLVNYKRHISFRIMGALFVFLAAVALMVGFYSRDQVAHKNDAEQIITRNIERGGAPALPERESSQNGVDGATSPTLQEPAERPLSWEGIILLVIAFFTNLSWEGIILLAGVFFTNFLLALLIMRRSVRRRIEKLDSP